MKILIYSILAGFALFFLGLVMRGCSWANKAADVAAAQIDPATMLKRYEWFKEASAQCDKKLADIRLYESRFKSMEESYKDTPRKDWDRTDREQYNLWAQEVAGTKAAYNGLAAEYNAAMAKANFRFTNIGDLPKGATEALPREMRGYE